MKTTEVEQPVLVDKCRCSSGVGIELVPKGVQVIAAEEIVLSTHTNNPVAATQHHKLFAGLVQQVDLALRVLKQEWDCGAVVPIAVMQDLAHRCESHRGAPGP